MICLLVKNDIDNDNYKVKIKELFNEESNAVDDTYYINKEKMEEKYLKPLLRSESENIINEKDIEKIYKEKTLKHPIGYSFFSWSGFFCFGKCPSLEKTPLINLGYAISSYFKTLKLLIFIFFVISCINLISVFHYMKFTPIYENKNLLLKTTLSNTRITKYNSIIVIFNSSEINAQDNLILNCYNYTVGKFIFGIKNDKIKENEIEVLQNFSSIEQDKIKIPKIFGSKWNDISIKKLNGYNKELAKVLKGKDATINKNIFFDSGSKSNYQSKLLYYECIDQTKLPKNYSKNSTKKIFHGTTIITLILLIFLYFYFSFSFKVDQIDYLSNKNNIQSFTLVLKDIEVNEDNYYKELNNLIAHFNSIIKNSIFDITISKVNKEKYKAFKKLKKNNKLIDEFIKFFLLKIFSR